MKWYSDYITRIMKQNFPVKTLQKSTSMLLSTYHVNLVIVIHNFLNFTENKVVLD